MQMFRVAAALVLCLFALLATPADARRVALVVGNGTYIHATPLRNPINDAVDITAALQRLGFEVIRGNDLGTDRFHAVIQEFESKLRGAEIALFYYSGHGLQLDNVNYLIPVDAKIDSIYGLERKAIVAQKVVDLMEKFATTSLVFLDACRNGGELTRDLEQLLPEVTRGNGATRGLARMTQKGNSLIAFAAAPNALAADGAGQRNSPFTAAVRNHIETPNVVVTEMLTDVAAEVERKTNRRQKPEVLSRLTTQVRLKASSAPNDQPAAREAERQRLIAEQRAKDAQDKLAQAQREANDAIAAAKIAQAAQQRAEQDAEEARQAAKMPSMPSILAVTPRNTCPSASGAPFQVTGVPSNDVLYMRVSPSPSAREAYSIPYNGRGIYKRQCTEVGSNTWCEVVYDCRVGWSNAHFLVAEGSPIQTSTIPPQVVASVSGGSGTRVVGVELNDKLWVRPRPGDLSVKLGGLDPGAMGIEKFECQPVGRNTWCRIRAGSLTGWVNARYLD